MSSHAAATRQASGRPSGYLSELERSRKTKPSASVVKRIADALGVSLDELLGRGGQPDAFSEFTQTVSLRPADREMLTSIKFEYPPNSVRRWTFIWDALRMSVALDDADVVAPMTPLLELDGPAVLEFLGSSDNADEDEARPFDIDRWTDVDSDLASALRVWDRKVDESKVFELADHLRADPSTRTLTRLLFGTYVWLDTRIGHGDQQRIGQRYAKRLFDGGQRAELEMALLDAWSVLLRSGAEVAYSTMCPGAVNHVEGLEPGISTAFLFFAGYEDPRVLRKPLIMDRTIGGALQHLTRRNWFYEYPFSYQQYKDYLSQANVWANFAQLQPKVVQRRLFKFGAHFLVVGDGDEFYS